MSQFYFYHYLYLFCFAVGRSAFCLYPEGKFKFNWGTMPTEPVSSKNTKLTFTVVMYEGGKHHMSVWLRCTSDDSVKIHLGDEIFTSEKKSKYRAYHIPHFHNTGINCPHPISDINSKIVSQFYTDCPKYYVEFQVVVVGTPACVSSIFFSKD